MRLKIGILLGIFLLIALIWFVRDDDSPDSESLKEETQQTRAFPVEVTKVSFEKVEHYLDAIGSFLPEDEVTVSTEVEGIVEKRFVDEGYRVKKGDSLIKIDDEEFRFQREEAEASLKEAEERLKNAELTLKRINRLLEEKVIDQQKYDDTVTQFNLSRATVENVKAKLKRYRKSLRDTLIVSPLGGVVSERMVSEGEYVKVGTNLLKIVDIDPLKLSFALPEKFSGQLKIGQTVEVETKAYPGKIFTGDVYFISPKVNLSTRTFEVKAKVKNTNYQLKPGFFVDVKLFLDVNESAMVLPEGAVVMREGRHVVLMVQGGKIIVKGVRPGKRFNGKVEILDGVDKDDLMVVSGLSELTDGSRVKVVTSKP
jgi:membrane fusion protein (multidrug efflux system)